MKSDQYLFGEKKKIEMIVHVWGEVKKPGEYRVADNTNVLELLSKAGGPTQFSNLDEIVITREETHWQQVSDQGSNNALLAGKNTSPGGSTPEASKGSKKRVMKINLKEYLENEKYKPLPILRPGDVLRIERNSWFKWQSVLRIATQVAIVVQAMYYFSRINN